MVRQTRRVLQGLSDSMRRHERTYGHYSRAFGLLIRLTVFAMVVLAIVMGQQRPYADSTCRARPDAAHSRVLATSIELAGSTHEIRRQLAGNMALTSTGPQAAAICIAERAEAHVRLLSLDGALFIPAYLMLATCVLCWLLAMSVHAVDAQGHWAPPRPALTVLLWLSALAVLGTAWLDVGENRAALQVLERANGIGAMANPLSLGLEAATAAAYAASLYKWLASAAWAATLGALVWHQRAVLANACGSSGWRDRTGRVLIPGFIGLAIAAALALLTGAAIGLLFVPGTGDNHARWARSLILLGFMAVSMCCLVLALLEAVRFKSLAHPARTDLKRRGAAHGPRVTWVDGHGAARRERDSSRR